jgi:hypothetical protein
MRRIKRVSRVWFVTDRQPAPAVWQGNAVTHFKECHADQTTVNGKKECFEVYQAEKAEKL